MNAYTQLLRHVKSISEQDDYITTILSRLPEDFDWEKGNIFPILNISALAGTFTSTSTIQFDVTITCVDKRDINKEDVNDKFWGNDNEVDNHNATLSHISHLWTKLNRDYSRENITASDNPAITQIEFEGMNLMDGWQITFQVEMPMNVSLC
tara:strand:+ start:533 stop:988 length:456 start_codon:yes stop_codon:yes gene_type:complete